MAITNAIEQADMDDLRNIVNALAARIAALEGKTVDAASVDEITSNLGDMRAGRFIAATAGENPTDADFSGAFVSAAGETFPEGTFHVGGVSNGELQFGLDSTNGKALSGGGAVTQDKSGITIKAASTYTNATSYKFSDGTNLFAKFQAYCDGVVRTAQIIMDGVAGFQNNLTIYIKNVTGQDSFFTAAAQSLTLVLIHTAAGIYKAIINNGQVDADTEIYGTSGTPVIAVDASANSVAINGNPLSGSNTGDQTITLTGDVTGSGTGSFAATIASKAVTLAKMADMATASLMYRKTAGSGAPEVQTLATLKSDLGLSGTNSGDQTITLTGDVTGSGTGSFAATIASKAVTLAKMADMATASLMYRKTAGSGAPEVQTLATLKTDLGLDNVTNGTYTPTATPVTNISGSPTCGVCQWMRIGDIVFVGGSLQADPTAAGACEVGISLPVASNLGATSDLNGSGASQAVNGHSIALVGDATNDRAAAKWTTVDVANRTMQFTFSYRVI